jgi:hypothetical protein
LLENIGRKQDYFGCECRLINKSLFIFKFLRLKGKIKRLIMPVGECFTHILLFPVGFNGLNE